MAEVRPFAAIERIHPPAKEQDSEEPPVGRSITFSIGGVPGNTCSAV
jgi:hypothetical protein